MSAFKDITGQKFNRLTVIAPAFSDKSGKWHWLCSCDCGNKTIVNGTALRAGKIKSCGCLRVEFGKRGTHQMRNSKLYPIYDSMKRRCYNLNNKGYKNYGGRGITVCDEWILDSPSFFSWALENGYKEGLTLDRVNNDGPYSPENCRWATYKEQCVNKRSNHWITFNGETKTVSQWVAITHISKTTILDRLKAGWTVERALTAPIRKYKK